jgi:flagellar protein FliO/FliZ
MKQQTCRLIRTLAGTAGLLCLGLTHAAVAATAATAPVAGGGLASGDLVGASLRMVGGLLVVLGLLGLVAWFSRRFRIGQRLRGGVIEVTSGLSLGAREKVVLLRVGTEQVLVGVSPAGMRTLHVLKEPAPAEFNSHLESRP